MSRLAPKRIHRVTVVVRRVEDVSDGVRAFEFADPDDWELPPFSAGGHIDVHVASGAVRQYSLYGDPAESNRYRIAVKRWEDGRGGSRALHDDVAEGDILSVSLPRNHFPLVDAPHHVMIAGGIGITPFLSMIAVLERTASSFELHYVSRSPEATPFLKTLAPLVERGLVHHHFTRVGPPRLDVARLVGDIRDDAHVYGCGPSSLMNAVRSSGARLEGRFHSETFGAPAVADPEYVVELARSGRVLSAMRGRALLSVLREAGVDIPAYCEAGVCLECKKRESSRGPPCIAICS